MFGAGRGPLHIVMALLSTKVINVNAKGANGGTALMFAAHRGHADIVAELLQVHVNGNE